MKTAIAIACLFLSGCETIGYFRERNRPVKAEWYPVYGPGDQVAFYNEKGQLLMISKTVQP